MTVRPCLGCGDLTSLGSRCAACRAAWQARQEQRRNGQRGTRQARGYDAEWYRVQRLAIAAQPWCSYCGSREDLTGDHVVSLSRGGVTSLDNVQVLCRRCNARKGNSTEQEGEGR